MKTKLMYIHCINIAALLIGALVFSSCNNPVMLGKKLNLDPPVVTIDTPNFMENIKGDFTIRGTAQDAEEVVFVTVIIERVSAGASWTQEWHGERGSWRSRNGDAPWELRAGEGIGWDNSKGKGNIAWSINVSMAGAVDGDYIISAGAENKVKNAGAMVQRRVLVDNEPPVLKLLTPAMEFDDHEDAVKYDYDTVIEPGLSKYQLRDPTVLDKLHNKKINIQYEMKDDFSLNTLSFWLAGRTDEEIYFAGEVPNPTWSGRFEILAKDILYPPGHAKAGYPVDYGDEHVFLQIISIASDKAGNVKSRSHGWLVYWPDADRPWTAGVGHISDPEEYKVFPEVQVQGQAYDNDGVHSVSYSIWTMNGTLIDEGTIINKPLDEGANPSTFFTWSFTAPVNCGEYRIDIDCVDMNGLPGDPDTRYFYVYDTDMPDIKINSPDPNVSLFGDIAGNFNISGTAGDGIMPTRLTLVWLNPNGNIIDSRINYQSADYEGWDLIDTIDSLGNKLWEVEMGLPGSSGNSQRVNRDFSKDFNLFSDLNIGAGSNENKLNAQTFILRLEGDSGRAVTATHSVRGDIAPPSVTIDRIKI